MEISKVHAAHAQLNAAMRFAFVTMALATVLVGLSSGVLAAVAVGVFTVALTKAAKSDWMALPWLPVGCALVASSHSLWAAALFMLAAGVMRLAQVEFNAAIAKSLVRSRA